MVGNDPSCSTVNVGVTMPSYFPVPAMRVLVSFPSTVDSSTSRLSPSASIASHTLVDLIFPSNEAVIPTQRKVFLSNMPPGGLLRRVPVFSQLDAERVLENVIVLATPDQQEMKS